jgi:hypothetical protein
MGYPGMHEKSWMGGNQGAVGGPPVMFLPAPMAFFGVLVAFMFGAVMGALLGKKKMMMMGAMGGKRWGKGMHHHHGFGMAPCRCEPASETGEMGQPGAGQPEERDEGE